MNVDLQPHACAERVRSGLLRRCAAESIGPYLAITDGLGAPRLWSRTRKAALRGVREACMSERSAKRAIDAAIQSVRDEGGMLIERHLPDIALLIATIDRDVLTLCSAGALRAYLHREGKSQRLTPQVSRAQGALHAVFESQPLRLQAGDILMFGTHTAFSTIAVERVSTTLQERPKVSATILVRMLTAAASDHEIGAAAAIARIGQA